MSAWEEFIISAVGAFLVGAMLGLLIVVSCNFYYKYYIEKDDCKCVCPTAINLSNSF